MHVCCCWKTQLVIDPAHAHNTPRALTALKALGGTSLQASIASCRFVVCQMSSFYGFRRGVREFFVLDSGTLWALNEVVFCLDWRHRRLEGYAEGDVRHCQLQVRIASCRLVVCQLFFFFVVGFRHEIRQCFGLVARWHLEANAEGDVRHCQLHACMLRCQLVVCQLSLVCQLSFFFRLKSWHALGPKLGSVLDWRHQRF